MKTNQVRIDIGFGVGTGRTGKPLVDAVVQAGLTSIIQVATDLFGGCTVYRTYGSWRCEKTGITHYEDGRTLTLYVKFPSKRTERDLTVLADLIKDRLMQQAVYIVKTPVNSQLY